MSQTLVVSNTGDSQSVDISQSSSTQKLGFTQSESAQTIAVNEQDKVQTIAVTQNNDIQTLVVAPLEKSQSLSLSNDVTFMKGDPGDKGDPGFSPIITVEETANGHFVTITDSEDTESFFVANGESVEEIPVSFIEAL